MLGHVTGPTCDHPAKNAAIKYVSFLFRNYSHRCHSTLPMKIDLKLSLLDACQVAFISPMGSHGVWVPSVQKTLGTCADRTV